jgi:ubiquinone/menaquinone biosynthesis C-methylase UbiE
LCARADDFDRLEGAVLANVLSTDKVTPRDRLTLTDLGSLKSPFRDPRAPVLIVRTDKGNLARLIVAHGFRETPDKAASTPVLVLERFETFEMPGAKNRIARGRGVWLFDKFRYDLDTGQVVPDGQGGDLQFLATGEGGARLVVEAPVKLYALNASPLPEDKSTPKRGASSRAIVPGDFSGRYKLFANGQLSGDLELSVNEQGSVTGSFRSDQTGSSYRVSGQVAPETPALVKFAITFPRSQQDFDGYLWSEGKGALAGTSTLVNRTFGFFAVREGGRVAPEDGAAALVLGTDQPINKPFVDPKLDVAEYVKRFESESREVYAKRAEIASLCNVRPGMAVADIGAGTGIYTFLFAEKVGADGTVYAVDIAPAFLKYLGEQAENRGVAKVVKPLAGGQDTTNLPPGSVDLVFICDAYHHFEKPAPMLASIHQALRPGGRVVLIDFDKRADSSSFVKSHVRAAKEVYFQEIESAGFRMLPIENGPALKENFIAQFQKVELPAKP